EMSLSSMARDENVSFSAPVPADLTIRQRLKWKDARYLPEYTTGSDPTAYLFMVGRCLARPELLTLTKNVIGPSATGMIKSRAGDGLGEVSITTFGDKKKGLAFALRGKGKEFLISIARSGNRWETTKFAVAGSNGAVVAQRNAAEKDKARQVLG